MDIDQELRDLCSRVAAELAQKQDKSRRNRLRDAARELDLGPGTDLRLMVGTLDRLKPTEFRKFERIVGGDMLQYCLNTRIGIAFAAVAEREGKDPVVEIGRLVAAAVRQAKKAPAASASVRAKKARGK